MNIIYPRLFVLCALFIATFTARAGAHDVGMTGVKVRLDANSTTVGVVAHLHDLKTSDAAREIAQRLRLRLDGRAFSPAQPQVISDRANDRIIWQAKVPLRTTWLALDAPVFPENVRQATVVSVFKNRQLFAEAMVDAQHPTAILGQKSAGETLAPVSSWQTIKQFVGEGIAHIFGGPDHILFLLSLLLLGGSWRQLLKIVTAFTLAHSLTLSLAATGTFSLPSRIVEPLIALSIVLVALTNFRTPNSDESTDEAETAPRKFDIRPLLAFGFGLVHGFGFASALSEIGLPRGALAAALVSFNVGVEIGQATLVLLFAPTLSAIVKKWPRARWPMIRIGSAGVAATGFFWFVQRLISA